MGHNSKAELLATDKVTQTRRVGPAPVDRAWHPIARRWYRAMRVSAVAEFFDASDWALVSYVASQMSMSLQVPLALWTAGHLKNVVGAAESLLSTEASRRRARIELERAPHGAGEKPKERRDHRSRLTVVPPASGDGTGGTATG